MFYSSLHWITGLKLELKCKTGETGQDGLLQAASELRCSGGLVPTMSSLAVFNRVPCFHAVIFGKNGLYCLVVAPYT